jgi:hypothetical protein
MLAGILDAAAGLILVRFPTSRACFFTGKLTGTTRENSLTQERRRQRRRRRSLDCSQQIIISPILVTTYLLYQGLKD